MDELVDGFSEASPTSLALFRGLTDVAGEPSKNSAHTLHLDGHLVCFRADYPQSLRDAPEPPPTRPQSRRAPWLRSSCCF